MNPIIQAMKERRSVRTYRPDPVPRDLLDQVLEAGLYAPSGMGTQRVITVAITDRALRDRLAAVNRQIGGWKDPSFDPFYGAPAVLIVLAERDSFGCPGHVRISYCVPTEQIRRALPKFRALAEEYGLK